VLQEGNALKDLREQYAGLAMQALVASNLIRYPGEGWNVRVSDEDRVEMVAELAIKQADALIKRLKACENAPG
jgi:hypothetical protein